MSYERPLINLPKSTSYKPESRLGLIIGIIILVVVIIVLIIVLIVLLLRKTTTTTVLAKCRNDADCNVGQTCSPAGKCLVCAHPEQAPTALTISSNPITGSATLNWASVSNASSYKIYRKLGDSSVSPSNHDSSDTTSTTSFSYNGLTLGTTYFVVTAVNSCGEGPASSPSVFSASCGSIPAAMPAPIVTRTLNDCAGATSSDVVQVAFTNQSISSGVYVIQGNGQKGNVSNYLYLVPGNSFIPAANIHLTCGTTTTSHNVAYINSVSNATILNDSPIAPIGSSYTLQWIPLAGVEEYVVFLVGVSATGVTHYYGTFAGAGSKSANLVTNSGDTLVFASVLGFRVCDKSSVSPSTTFVTGA